MAQNFSIDVLFDSYRAHYANKLMDDEQLQNLRHWHHEKNQGITHSQIDCWMMQAGLIDKRKLSLIDTGLIYSKFKKFALTLTEFKEFLDLLATSKEMDVEAMILKLEEIGHPAIEETEIESRRSSLIGASTMTASNQSDASGASAVDQISEASRATVAPATPSE